MSGARRAAPRSARILPLLVLMAVGFGFLAAVLATPAPTPGPQPSPAPSQPLPVFTLVSTVVVIFLFGYIAWQIYKRVRGGRVPIPGRAALTGVVALLVAVAFVFVVALVHPGGVLGGGNNGGDRSGGSGSSNNGQGNATGGPGNGLIGFGSPLPGLPQVSWTLLAVIGLGVGLAVAALVVYTLRGGPRGAGTPDAARIGRLRSEFERTLRELESDPDADPRDRILALYQRLLLALHLRVRGLAEQTAREIEREIVGTFRVDASAAHELTLLFEEARYSTHPLGHAEFERARGALTGVLRGLDAARAEALAAPIPA
ncbi:MAG TPA: DUF4129 domain-containing protein [Thermoplasmata archaeon]|nr:DUF4129 domain-containing protein [Thermoplasmata archaeon]